MSTQNGFRRCETPRSFPALKRAGKILDRAARAGVRAERDADASEDGGEAAIGDALLRLCALARKNGVDAEIALNAAADRFIERFAELEAAVRADGGEMPLTPDCVKKYMKRDIL